MMPTTPMTLETLFAEALEHHASDLHLAAGLPPVFRVNGLLRQKDGYPVLDEAAVEALVLPALSQAVRATLTDDNSPTAEAVVSVPEHPDIDFCLLVFRAKGGLAATVRIVRHQIPTLNEIGGRGGDGTARLEQMAALPRGMVLFTGPTGSGKMTTAAAVVDHINRHRSERIYVLEETPGYGFRSKISLVTTLRIGQDFPSYEHAAGMLLHGADPDVVLFSDLPTLDAVRQALILADTGHLVFAVVHAESAAQTVADLVASFEKATPGPLRAQLARTLVAVWNQRLLPRAGGTGREVAYEIMTVTAAIRERIQQGASAAGFDAVMAASAASNEQRPLDAALDALVALGAVAAADADGYRVRSLTNS